MNKIKNKKTGLALSSSKGFTLIEILVVIGIIAILAAVVLVAINPARQFAQARDSQRVSNLNAILNAIGQRIADHKGLFHGDVASDPSCQIDILGASSTITNDTSVSPSVDLRLCLVPTYLSELPLDPTNGVYDPTGAYNTGYQVYKDANGRIHVFASTTEPNIPRMNAIEIVR